MSIIHYRVTYLIIAFLFAGLFFFVSGPAVIALLPPYMVSLGIFMFGNFTPKEAAPVEIDGRTPGQWFEIIKMMGKEEFEKLSRPALDGLKDSSEGIGGWDVKGLLGEALLIKLRREFYPEQFCSTCDRENGDGHENFCLDLQEEVLRIQSVKLAREARREELQYEIEANYLGQKITVDSLDHFEKERIQDLKQKYPIRSVYYYSDLGNYRKDYY